MSYKSTHTGSQIDEAVDKVLNNQVGKADWNAKVGEVGYIENKTHFFNPTSKVSKLAWSIDNSTSPRKAVISLNGGYIYAFNFSNNTYYIKTDADEVVDMKILDAGPLSIHYKYVSGNHTLNIQHYTENLTDDFLTIYEASISTAESLSSILKKLDEIFLPNSIAHITDTEEMTSILYADLVNLRNNSKLKPGHQYRIVDYTTTTTQTDTLSAGNQFDIIVTADDVNVLNEKARACKSEFNEFSIERYKDAIYHEVINGDEYIYPVEYMGEFVYNGKKYYRYYIDAYSSEILIDWEGSSSLQTINTTIPDYPEYKYEKKSDVIRRNENGVWRDWSVTDSENIIVKNDIPNYSYFANSDLNVWELKYCLDNDIARFDWAQEIVLSPVSKRKIISVYDNDGYSYIYLRYPEGDKNGEYAWVYDYNGDDDSIKEYVRRGEEDFDSDDCIYTTTPNPSVGYSINDYSIVEEVSSTASGKGVIYYMKDEWNNECPYDFKNIKFRVTSGQSVYNYYTFNSYNGDDTIYGVSSNNVIKPYMTNNYMRINNIRFGYNCNNNIFGNDCYDNTFDDSCNNNIFGNDCCDNTFGNNCRNNTFGNNCTYNTFGNSCKSNTFGNSSNNNIFGNSCESNNFGNSSNNNTFGNYCDGNTFGNNCTSNKFGNSCKSNRLGDDCAYNYFGSSATQLKNYYRYIVIDNGNKFITLNCTATTSSNSYFQNVRIGLGVSNNTYKTISNSETNQLYETLYRAANSKTLKPDGTSF